MMRPSLLTGLVVLQVVGLGDGLPHPSPDVYDEDLSPGTWTQTTQATLKVVLSPEDIQNPAAANNDRPSLDQDQSASPAQGDLNRELTELQALRAHLAELEKEVSTREEWLAAATGTTPPPALTDCDTLSCVLNAIWRKTKYTLSTLFTSQDNDDSDDGSRTDTNTTIPLPPWRRPNNNTATDPDTDRPAGGNPSKPDGTITTQPQGFNPWYAFAVFLASFLVFSLLRRLIRRAISGRRHRDEEWDGLVLHAREPCGSSGIQAEEPPRRWWRWVGKRVWGGLRLGWREREGGARLADEVDIEARCEYRDEKVGFADEGEGEAYWDEKGVEGLDEEGGGCAHRDERECWSSEEEGYVREDEVQSFQGGDENVVESDERCRRELLDTPSTPYSSRETSSLGDELASFRMAVDLVESMFAAEQGRARER